MRGLAVRRLGTRFIASTTIVGGKVLAGLVDYPLLMAEALACDLAGGRCPIRRYTEYFRNRGMNQFIDMRDWLGGYPFEFAKPEEILDFCRKRGFVLTRLITVRGYGCNEFVFRKSAV